MKSSRMIKVEREYKEGVKALFYSSEDHYVGWGRVDEHAKQCVRPAPASRGGYMSRYNTVAFRKLYRLVGKGPFNEHIFQEIS
jgi:hypothetical protein